MTKTLRRSSAVALLAVAATIGLSTPSFAAYDATTCTTLGSCSTGAIYPHSSQHWLRASFTDLSSAYCPLQWDLWDATTNSQWTEGGMRLYAWSSSKTITIYNLDPNHRYYLEATSLVCSVRLRLANYT